MGSYIIPETQTIEITVQSIDNTIYCKCSLQLKNENEVKNSSRSYWQGVDVLFDIHDGAALVGQSNGDAAVTVSMSSESEPPRTINSKQLGSPAALAFIVDSIKDLAETGSSTSSRGCWKFILPQGQGYIVRSDILTTRMLDCDFATKVVDFAAPVQQFSPPSQNTQGIDGLLEIVRSSIGGVLVHQDADRTTESYSKLLDAEIDKRMSFPWLTLKPAPRKTIALFEGRVVPKDGDMIYAAAKAMNMDVIVIDHPGHWTEDPKHSDIREAFLPVDITPDDGLGSRIVKALEYYGKPVDGIWTVADVFTEGVARAAKQLGLPFNSPEGFNICSDKYKMRKFQNMPAHRTRGNKDLSPVLNDKRFRYPLIVKPCLGWNSEGVSKVYDEAGLRAATTSFKTSHHGHDVVIENYCGGPELDVNFILEDGKVVWFEAHDDFPKCADMETPGVLQTFLETGNVIPSGLPQSELDMMRDSLHHIMDQLGLKHGVYHLEARVQDSSMHYDMKDGILDLVPNPNPPTNKPKAFLVELNPRPPGAATMVPLAYAYGLDYAALGMLYAIGDHERAHALLHPYVGGAQGWYEIIAVPATKGGVFDSVDVTPELLKRRPHLKSHVIHSRFWYEKGDVVPDPTSGTFAWIAVILVRSRKSRFECREIAEEVRRELQFTIRPE